jgi:uncharacterized Tic20 family protein
MANNQHTSYGNWGPAPGNSLPPAALTPSGSPPSGEGSAPPDKQATRLAGLAHLSSFFAPLVVPLIIWLVVRDRMPYAARQAKQAICLHLVLVALGLFGVLVLWWSLVSSLFAAAQALTSTVATTPSTPSWLVALVTFAIILGLTVQALCIYGATQAFGGQDFSYPGLRWL